MKFILLLSFLLLTTPAIAETPLPSSHPMKEVEQKLKDRKEYEKKLKEDLKNIKSDLALKRKKLLSVAKEIKKNEGTLSQLENTIEKKQEEQTQLESSLVGDKKSISELILALERIRRIPPEAIISRPDSPLKTAQSTMLLQSILPRIYKRADQLKADLEKLDSLLKSLEKDRSTALQLSKELKKHQSSLNALLSERESIYARTEKDIEKQQAELSKISQQARNLKELVKKIEEKQRLENQRRKEQKASAQTNIHKTTPIPKTGDSQLPVGGIIVTSYGKTDDIGAISQGIKVNSRSGALVVAPMGGIVDYAGAFKGYGQIIILKHQKGYHSLIAGLGKIDTVVGRAVSAGEPIGKMPSESAPTLYYELRHKGIPVNPSKKISGLR